MRQIRDQQIRHFYEEDGLKQYEIAKRLNLDLGVVHRALKSMGLGRYDRGGDEAREARREEMDEARRLSSQGKGVKAIALAMQQPVQYVKNLLLDQGLTDEDIRVTDRDPAEIKRRKKIIEDYMSSNATQAEVGRRWGISGARVSQILKDEGHTANERKKRQEKSQRA